MKGPTQPGVFRAPQYGFNSRVHHVRIRMSDLKPIEKKQWRDHHLVELAKLLMQEGKS